MSPGMAADLEAAPEAAIEGSEEAGAAQAAAATPGRRTPPPCRSAIAPAPLPAEPDRQRSRAPRRPRPFPCAALHRLAVVTMPGAVHRVELTMFCIQWRCTISSVFHRVDSTQWVAANLKSQVKGLV